MPYFYYNKPNNDYEIKINSSFNKFFDDITKNHKEVFKNDLKEMSNSFRRYGALNQFNNNYHYFKVILGTPDNPRKESHRYRTQIICAYLEREFNKDFEIHHFSFEKDEFGKYNDKSVIIIYGDSKYEVKEIHQKFHKQPINFSSRIRGEIK